MAQAEIEQLQREADEVKVLMVENVKKVDERDDKLHDLEVRSERLLSTSHGFQKQSMKIKKKQDRANLKSKAGLIAIVAVLFLIIIIVAAVMFSSTSGSPDTVKAPPTPSSTTGSSGK